MARGIELQGTAQLLAALRQRSEKAAARVERKGLRAGGEVMAEGMRERVNVSERDGPHMRDNISVSGVRRKDGMKYVQIGPNRKVSFRAHFNEFGTSKHPAQPFIEPGYHAKKGDALNAIAEELRKGLRS